MSNTQPKFPIPPSEEKTTTGFRIGRPTIAPPPADKAKKPAAEPIEDHVEPARKRVSRSYGLWVVGAALVLLLVGGKVFWDYRRAHGFDLKSGLTTAASEGASLTSSSHDVWPTTDQVSAQFEHAFTKSQGD